MHQAGAGSATRGASTARGAVVLGVSPDDEASHVKFKEKYSLPFTLLADPDHAVATEYGAWGEKKNYGKTYEGIIRSTFVIGPDGTLVKTLRNVKPDGHAERVLAVLPSPRRSGARAGDRRSMPARTGTPPRRRV